MTPIYYQPIEPPIESAHVPDRVPRDERSPPRVNGTTPIYYQPTHPRTESTHVPGKVPRDERPPPQLRWLPPTEFKQAPDPRPTTSGKNAFRDGIPSPRVRKPVPTLRCKPQASPHPVAKPPTFGEPFSRSDKVRSKTSNNQLTDRSTILVRSVQTTTAEREKSDSNLPSLAPILLITGLPPDVGTQWTQNVLPTVRRGL